MSENTPFAMSDQDNAAFLAMSQDKEIPALETTEEPAEEVEQQPEAQSSKAADPAKKPSMVPHQALHEARLEAKAAREEAQRIREQNAAMEARVEERLRRLQEIQSPTKDPNDPPNFDEDPLAYVKWVGERVQQQSRQQTEEQQRVAQYERFRGDYAAKAQEFIREEPAFPEAYGFLTSNRIQEYLLAGYSQQQAIAATQQDETNIAWQAMQQGINPAKRMMELAKHRGWAPKAKEAAQPGADEKIAATADALNRGKSMSSAGGAATPGAMDAKTLLAMSNDDFDAWCNKHPAQAKRLMGG